MNSTRGSTRPKAAQLSLPPFRERHFLAENYVERSKGRQRHFAPAGPACQGSVCPPSQWRSRIPVACNSDGSTGKARRLSLPTFRERRFLSENYVERAKGRPKHFARVTAFTLTVWPLVVRDLSPEEQRRKDAWRKRQLIESKVATDQTELPGVQAESLAEENVAPEEEREFPLIFHTDSNLIEEADTPEQDANNILDHDAFNIPPWAYIVRIRVSKNALGKRAVQRNRAKRRIKAAASEVFPDHASRGREYIFASHPEALTINYRDLVVEVQNSLKKAGCWEDKMAEEALRREKYCTR